MLLHKFMLKMMRQKQFILFWHCTIISKRQIWILETASHRRGLIYDLHDHPKAAHRKEEDDDLCIFIFLHLQLQSQIMMWSTVKKNQRKTRVSYIHSVTSEELHYFIKCLSWSCRFLECSTLWKTLKMKSYWMQIFF